MKISKHNHTNLRLKKSMKLAVLSAYLCGSMSIYAAGLGHLSVKSTLDKPLVAEIEVIGKVEPNTTAEIASVDEYTKEHLDYSADLAEADLKIIKQKDRYIIRITTKANFNEPVINLLLKLSYSGQTIKKSYTKFIELAPANDINTARVVDNSINPTADLANPTTAMNTTTNTGSGDSYGDVQITNNKKVILNQTPNNQSNQNNNDDIKSDNSEPIQHSGTIYIEKKSDNQQISTQAQTNKPKEAEKSAKPATLKTENKKTSTKQIEISVQKSAKVEATPQSTNTKLDKPEQAKKAESKPEKKEEDKKTVPDIQQKAQNKPTLKLDEPSAVELFKQKERQMLNASSTASASNTDLGLGLGGGTSATDENLNANLASGTNSMHNSISSETKPNSASSVQNNKDSKANEAVNGVKPTDRNVGIFEVIRASVVAQASQPLFYIIIFSVILLSFAFAYILHIKKQFAKNIQQTKEALILLQQQVMANTGYNNQIDKDNNDNIGDNTEFTEDETNTNDKKRKRKRGFAG
ncbi:MAG: hypothetical protein RLZZ210_770 [Pseudomonadota bacterium]